MEMIIIRPWRGINLSRVIIGDLCKQSEAEMGGYNLALKLVSYRLLGINNDKKRKHLVDIKKSFFWAYKFHILTPSIIHNISKNTAVKLYKIKSDYK